MTTVTLDPLHRAGLLRRAVRLEYLTVGWNVVEGLVAITAALATGSVALLGFGVDSFVESASGLVLLWPPHAEPRTTSHGPHRAGRTRAPNARHRSAVVSSAGKKASTRSSWAVTSTGVPMVDTTEKKRRSVSAYFTVTSKYGLG